MPRFYLTGASGLLGSHLAERLRGRGDEVVCLQRPGSDTRHLRALGCEVVAGNVRDGPEALVAGMRGCHAVVHGAALVYVGGPWPRLRQVNVEGTSHVVRAAGAAGVRRVVHLSSIAVYGGRCPDEEGAEEGLDTPLQPCELYARSKREAEAAARAAAEHGRLHLAIVRPAALYGERDRLLTPRLASLLRLPVVPLLGRGDNALPLLYAGNAASAVEHIVDQRDAVGVFDLGRDHPLTQRALLEGLARGIGRSPRLLPVPAPGVRQVARVAEALGLALPGAGDLTLERFARLGLEDNPHGAERLRHELGWAPPFTHDQGLRRTAEWLRSQHDA